MGSLLKNPGSLFSRGLFFKPGSRNLGGPKHNPLVNPLFMLRRSHCGDRHVRPQTEALHCTSPDLVIALRYAASLPTGTELDQLKLIWAAMRW